MLRIKARLAGLWVGSLIGLMMSAQAVQAQVQEDFPTQVGTAPLQLPLPQGFSEPSASAPGFRKLGETMTPATNRLLALTAYRVEVAGKAQEIPMAMGVSTLALKGKMVYFYAYSRYRDAADLAWIKTQTLDWLRRAGS